MEAGHSAAGDGYEQSGEHIAQRGAGGSQRVLEAGEGGHVHGGVAADDAHHGQDHHGVQQEGAQVVAGLQQDPHGGDGCDGDIQANDDHPSVAAEIDGVPLEADVHAHGNADDADDGGNTQRRIPAIDKEAEDDGHQDEHDGDDGGGGVGGGSGLIQHAVHIGGLEGVGHDGGKGSHHQDQGQVCEDDEQLLGPGADGVADDLADGFALMANGGEQGAEIMDAAEEDAADQDPQHNGNPAEHSGLDGAVDGACAGDRGKVMAHQNGSLGGTVVLTVLQLMGRGDAGVIHAPLLGQPAAVENISYDQHGNANDQEQSSIHKLLSFRNNFLFCL